MNCTESTTNRRSFLGTMAYTPLAACVPAFLTANCGIKPTKPNIVLIFSDDQGMGDVSCFGGAIETPHIDSIASSGMKFASFYASGPVCTPSRYGILTGCYPFRANSRHFLGALMPGQHDDAGLKPHEVTVARMLKDYGYRTALIGKWHLGHGGPESGPNSHGFDYFYGFLPGCVDFYRHTYRDDPAWYRNTELIDEDGYATDLLTDEAIRYIESGGKQPFFLYLAYNAPHYGKAAEGNLLQAPREFHEEHPTASDREIYTAMVKSMDDGIGRVLEAVRSNGIEDNTIIIFISDNGGSLPYGASNIPYRGEKATLWEGGIRVPCVMQWKGRIPSGATSAQAASNIDIMPTLAALTGARLPSRTLDGIDLSDVLTDGAVRERRIVFKLTRGDIAIIDGHWKYIYSAEGFEHLFDLAADSLETNDLAASMPEKAAEMRTALERELART